MNDSVVINRHSRIQTGADASGVRRNGVSVFAWANALNRNGWDSLKEAIDLPRVGIFYPASSAHGCHTGAEELANHCVETFRGHRIAAFTEGYLSPNDAMPMGGGTSNLTSLAMRDTMAMQIELTARNRGYDAIIILVGCDKTIPAGLIAAAWLSDRPVTLIYLGTRKAAPMPIDELRDLLGDGVDIGTASQTWGHCAIAEAISAGQCETLQFAGSKTGRGGCEMSATSFTMAGVAAGMGMLDIESASIPAENADSDSWHDDRVARCTSVVEQTIAMMENGWTAQNIVTRQSLLNAVTYVLAAGGSTNAVAHLFAIAEAYGCELTDADWVRLGKKVKFILNLKPGGEFTAPFLHLTAGGMKGFFKRLIELEWMFGDCQTIAMKSLGELVADAVIPDEQRIILDPASPVLLHQPLRVIVSDAKVPEGCTNLAADGGVFKVHDPNCLELTGELMVFATEDDFLDALAAGDIHQALGLKLGDEIDPQSVEKRLVVYFPGLGVTGSPGSEELLSVTGAVKAHHLDAFVALLMGCRLSGVSGGSLAVHLEPEAANGGVIGRLQNGDQVTLNFNDGLVYVHLDGEALDQRPPLVDLASAEPLRGSLAIIRRHMSPLHTGARLGW